MRAVMFSVNLLLHGYDRVGTRAPPIGRGTAFAINSLFDCTVQVRDVCATAFLLLTKTKIVLNEIKKPSLTNMKLWF